MISNESSLSQKKSVLFLSFASLFPLLFLSSPTNKTFGDGKNQPNKREGIDRDSTKSVGEKRTKKMTWTKWLRE
jgi:hypothetical protein